MACVLSCVAGITRAVDDELGSISELEYFEKNKAVLLHRRLCQQKSPRSRSPKCQDHLNATSALNMFSRQETNVLEEI